ncbi:hypothetical protein C7G42_11690 [Bradyrhizobium sp. MOS003]|nr:hypothetical protein C7G42_11690 [Bradyrhizobium sp. MOS003]
MGFARAQPILRAGTASRAGRSSTVLTKSFCGRYAIACRGGFRWFFSFYTVFSADTRGGHAEDAILLLDEPGL